MHPEDSLQIQSWRDFQLLARNSMILLANSAQGLTDDRMAHLGLKSQANSSNPLKRVKPLPIRHYRHLIAVFFNLL
jgi:hypothetical protein